jgi:outer membrane protein insertion porin family
MFKRVGMILGFVLLAFQANAQIQLGNTGSDEISYTNPKEYIIGGITIGGNNKLDAEAVLLISGISVGDTISIPGDKTQKLVRKFWEQGLFSNVKLNATKIEAGKIFLEIYLDELPRLSMFSFKGLVKHEVEKIKDELNLYRGKIITQDLVYNSKHIVKRYFVDKGYLNTSVDIKLRPDTSLRNGQIADIYIDKNDRVKIKNISFKGLNNFSEKKLLKTMKNTKEKNFFRIFKASRYLESNFKEDKAAIIDLYNQKGYRDARIISDTMYRNDEKTINIDLVIEEGKQYFFRDIDWVGNTKHSSEKLAEILGIQQGDIFDAKLLQERSQQSFAGDDIKSLYMDEGYLFCTINPVEVLVENDSIDFEIRIHEGNPAIIRDVNVVGNTKTKDHVIYRELRTTPGSLFRKSDVIRSQEELIRLGYFNPQKLGVNPKPDPSTGMVDIEYSVEETSTDQIQLQGGWGANSFVGTLGLSLNNFSIQNLFKKEKWDPIPSGDGQRMSIQATSNGDFYQSYNISFTEPWLRGDKPNSLSITLSHSIFNSSGKLKSTGLHFGLGKRLAVPDDYFTLMQNLSIQRYNLSNYTLVRDFRDGHSNNINYRVSLSRNSVFNQFYPKSGSTFTVSGEFTPPYSLFDGKDYSDPNMTSAEKYEFLEYYKMKFSTDWYTNLFSDFVIRTHSFSFSISLCHCTDNSLIWSIATPYSGISSRIYFVST